MKCYATVLPEVRVIEPDIFEDNRGFFMETWNASRYAELGIAATFVQDNLSLSSQGILRGLHFQQPNPQGKLVQVLQGEVFDVAVDIRNGSPTFGQWVGITLTADNRKQLFIPEGFAHGFCVVSQTALLSYKCTDFYYPQHEGGICWNDSELAITWPVAEPALSVKDKQYPELKAIPLARLPILRIDG
ncbi:dTDP-4-dehydrorhamnose 3,5-epimerase [Sporomusa termitida]|uniref:dTDP-4-dehydrorhamnose 3,5-epimerase n=1 Tax=Sporomusa termitida TaxID=2377 RepID=A0A517DZL1_9FIRM|nr:dTDP-4-dehydrorhamnose 3,5-epimerase [Sporomusa termitida]QDR82789.1 dTDP-4-dehydrorhamnose 3,5-epimerase [Sporomusa termitida]